MIADDLGDDIARARQRIVDCRHVRSHERRGKVLGAPVGAQLFKHHLRECIEATLACDAGAGAAFLLVGLIQVLKLGLGHRRRDALAQWERKFALFLNRCQDRPTAFFESAQAFAFGADLSNLLLVQPTGTLFAIACDERYGVSRSQ